MRLSLDQTDELGIMASTMDNYAEKLQKNLIGTLQMVAKGAKNIQLIPAADDKDEIAPAVNTMITTIDSVVGEVNGAAVGDRAGDPARARQRRAALHGHIAAAVQCAGKD